MSVTVRELKNGDFFNWFDVYSGYAEFYETELTDDKAVLAWSQLIDPGHEMKALVAVDEDGRMVGLAHYRPFTRTLDASRGLFVDDLFVLDDARKSGVGRALLDAVRDYAAAHSFSVVRLITAPDNETAQQLYDSLAERTSWVTYELKP